MHEGLNKLQVVGSTPENSHELLIRYRITPSSLLFGGVLLARIACGAAVSILRQTFVVVGFRILAAIPVESVGPGLKSV